MTTFINIIQELIVGIRNSISGNSVVTGHSEIDRVKRDIYNMEIPTFKDDRINLKKDCDAATRAYTKGVEEKQLQLQD